MQTYNRALDHVALALNAGRKGNNTLAAKLLAAAIAQPDVIAAIQTLEASNKHAFALQARRRSTTAGARRLRASEEDVFDELTADDMGDDMDDMDEAGDMSDLEASDDMDDMDDDMEDPAETMASVLKSMTKKRG